MKIQWIPVTQALPDIEKQGKGGFDNPCMVFLPGVGLTVAYYGTRMSGKPEFYLGDGTALTVTHWLPYPEFPV